MYKVLFLLLASLLALGCAKAQNTKTQDEVAKRAVEDMKCDESDLDFKCVKDKAGIYGRRCVHWGVSGCRKKYSYVHQDGEWKVESSRGGDIKIDETMDDGEDYGNEEGDDEDFEGEEGDDEGGGGDENLDSMF